MWIKLIDTGAKICIRTDYQNMYELPKEIQHKSANAVLCKVLEVRF